MIIQFSPIRSGSLSGFSMIASRFYNIPITYLINKIGDKAHLQ